jgi:hypothetical protein
MDERSHAELKLDGPPKPLLRRGNGAKTAQLVELVLSQLS